MKDFGLRHHLSYPLLLDHNEQYASQFDLQGVPTNVLVDPFGRIVEIGGTTPAELRRLLKRAILRDQVNVHSEGAP